MYAHDFLDAQDSLSKISVWPGAPADVRALYGEVAGVLATAQRFHLPAMLNLISQTADWGAIWPTIKLPFPVTAIHSTTEILGAPPGYPSCRRLITLATSLDELVPGACDAGSLSIVSLVKHETGWHCVPGAHALVRLVDGKLGIRVLDSFLPHLDEQAAQDFEVDVKRVIELCTLLALHNVTTETIAAAGALQRSRQKKGKPPLPDYRVLRVGGELWHNELSHQNNARGAAFRSHMRRGHIRRLDDERTVWVRSTYVHGSKAGFVAKEYHAGVPA